MLFVTGTDTGVGKTVLSALLLYHLRSGGRNALAMKPMCTGNRRDALTLHHIQNKELMIDIVNPFHYRLGLAPLAASMIESQPIKLEDVVESVLRIQEKCDVLIVEGIGGLLVPIAERVVVLDVIRKLACKVLVVARNQLGTINHTLLTVRALHSVGIQQAGIILMGSPKPDASASTNTLVLQGLLDESLILEVPFLGRFPVTMNKVKKSHEKVKKSLALLLNSCNV